MKKTKRFIGSACLSSSASVYQPPIALRQGDDLKGHSIMMKECYTMQMPKKIKASTFSKGRAYLIPTLSVLALLGFMLYAEASLALDANDSVAELETLTKETTKIVKNGCFIAGTASALVGTIWCVASQSLKVAASSAVITILSMKASTFFASTLLI